jgi:hypothetical protein
MSIDRGDITKLRFEVRNAVENLADPDEIILIITPPDGVQIERKWPEGSGITHESTGIFSTLVEATQADGWDYRWETIGAIELAESGSFFVEGDAFEQLPEAWFTVRQLKDTHPQFKKLQDVSETYARSTVIPKAEDFVTKFISPSEGWSSTTVPPDVRRVAMNYAVNRILADDENIRIAQARGQPRFTVAGDEVVLDLSLNRNPLLSLEDEQILMDWRGKYNQSTHTDKIVVASEGDKYDEAPGGGSKPATDYVRRDRIPPYFAGQ